MRPSVHSLPVWTTIFTGVGAGQKLWISIYDLRTDKAGDIWIAHAGAHLHKLPSRTARRVQLIFDSNSIYLVASTLYEEDLIKIPEAREGKTMIPIDRVV